VEPKTTSVRFTSNPGNAELEVDGEYWGSTPTAELTRLREGSHVIVVKKPGYQKWERKVNLGLGEPLAVHADLQEEAAVGGRARIAGLQ
jgi:hypothetical protein